MSCTSLTTVSIGNGVTSIGDTAFAGCSSLTSVTIPDSVTSIGGGAFASCTSLKTVTINSNTIVGNNTYTTASNIGSIFGKQVTKYVIGDNVGSIGADAFSECSDLTSVTIGNSVTSIGTASFAYSGLKSVMIPDSVTSIESVAFCYCSSLASVSIGNSVTSIGKYAFGNCPKLTSVTINANAIVNKKYTASNNISDIFDNHVTKYIIGDDVKGIGELAISNCSMASVTIGKSVTSIGFGAFIHCKNLVTVSYNGTKYQWKQITKESRWIEDTSATVVHCTDGDVDL